MSSRLRTAALLAAAVPAVLPFAAGYLLPQGTYVVVGLAALAGYSLPAVAAVTLAAAALRQWVALGALALVLVGVAATLGPSYVADSTGKGDRLVVMTANLYFGEADPRALVDAVRRQRVEILALEELTPDAVERLRAAGLEELLPYTRLNPAPAARGAGLWSSRPLTPVPAWPSAFEGGAADLDVSGARVRVRVLHPPPPRRGALDEWEHDYDGFVDAARREGDGPTLLLGDFNATEHHRRLRRLMDGRWRDAAALGGAGLVRTWGPWPDRPAIVDPDHVLVDRDMSVRRYATLRLPGSDHRAVIATVVLPTRP